MSAMLPPAGSPRRPRDELGRPLPWGAQSRLRMEDYDALPFEENQRLGIEHFNRGQYFPAHEAWESAWKQARGTPDEQFFRGLAQLGAGYTHCQRGNHHGAHTLMVRALARLRMYAPRHAGLDVDALCRAVTADAEAIRAAEAARRPLPPAHPPRL